MKILTIALKDLQQSFRSLFALGMMLAFPLLTTGVIYFAFGGLVSDGEEAEIAQVQVQFVNLDRSAAQAGNWSIGQELFNLLRSPALAGFLQATTSSDAAAARAAVDRQEADVAVILPRDLTANALAPEGQATVTLYEDPTATLGPQIVKGLVESLLDSFSGNRIALQVAQRQFQERGQPWTAAVAQRLTADYTAWAKAQGQALEGGSSSSLEIIPPPSRARPQSQLAEMVGQIMAAMMVFSVFFSGAATAESIIREDEEGTLSRLWTTPTSRNAILGGKFVAVVLILVAQVLALLVIAGVVFGIHWGRAETAALVILGLVVLAAGFGIFIMSLVRDTRQAGPVMGVVLTLSGMAGGVMTAYVPNLPPVYDTITLFTPHGWALRALKMSLDGAGAAEVLAPVGVMLVLGAGLFLIGSSLFRRRFA